VLLRRRGDLELVMAQLGGELFATRGKVDKYFLPGTYCPACAKWITHLDAQERCGNTMYWLHPVAVIKGDPVLEDFERNPETEKEIIDETIQWWKTRCTPELIHKRLVARNPKMSAESLQSIQDRVLDHIRSAPEREAAALREWVRSTNWRWKDL
jgi:hypothetical protein